MKKKVFCVFLATVLVLSLFCLVCCKKKPLDKVAKNCDNYTIVAAYDQTSHCLSAVQTVELKNRTQNSFSAIKFHLYANGYRQDAQNPVVPDSYKAQAYPAGQSFGDISLDSVKLDGTPVAFTIEGDDMDILSVPVEQQWMPDKKATVEMTYTVTLANIKHRLGWTENTVNLGNFFPVLCHIKNDNFVCSPYYNIGDPFVSEVANFDVTVKFPEKYVVAASGNLQEATADNGYVRYRYTGQALRDFAIVASENFKLISETQDGVTVNYYYFNDTDAENSLATAVGAYKYFCKNVGAYPYKQLSVCETEFCYGGMEYPSLVMVTSGAQSYQEAIVHETAHQWFYGVVGNDQIADAWMDEGLAEFLTYLYLDSCGKTKLSQSILGNMKTYTTYVDVLDTYYNKVDSSFRSLEKYRNDNEYVVMTYVKGSLLFNTLYETMGASKFWKALQNYYTEAMFTVASPDQLAQCFAKVGGKELANIITQFVEGKEVLGKVTDK